MFRRVLTSEDYAARSPRAMLWFLQRVTGFVMVFTLIGHFLLVHTNAAGGAPVSVEGVAARLGWPGMKLLYLVFLASAAFHGANGMMNILDDYVHRAGWRWAALTAVWAVAVFVLLRGALALFGV